MSETPGALDKLYSMLREANQLGLSRPVRLRLIGIIGSLENEELDRYRNASEPRYRPDPDADPDRAPTFSERLVGR